MVEPLSTAAAASTATAATDAVTSAATGAANSAGNWLTNALTAPFRWAGSLISAPFQAIAEVPGNIFGAIKGGAQNILSFSNAAAIAAGTFALTLMKLTFAPGWRDALALTSDKATATKQINEIVKDGVTGVAFDSLKQSAAVVAGFRGISGAFEGGGLLAGGGVVAAVGALTYMALSSPATPKAVAADKAENTKA